MKTISNVWVVVEDYYSEEIEGNDYDNTFCGVFSTKDKAKEYIKEAKKTCEAGQTYRLFQTKVD